MKNKTDMFFNLSILNIFIKFKEASVAVLKTVNSATTLNMCSATHDFQNIRLGTLMNTCG